MAAQRFVRFEARAQEKRESRAHDLERLARGEISSADLQIENGFFSALDMHSITLVRSSGVRYRLPSAQNPSAQDPVKEVAISSQTAVYVKSMKIGPGKASRKTPSRKRALRRAGA